jgi:hypothetical protein
MTLTVVVLAIAVVLLLWRYGVVSKALRIIRAESDDLRSRFDALRAAKDENDNLNARDISILESRLCMCGRMRMECLPKC